MILNATNHTADVYHRLMNNDPWTAINLDTTYTEPFDDDYELIECMRFQYAGSVFITTIHYRSTERDT